MLKRPDLVNLPPVKDLWELADRLEMMPANDDASAEHGFSMYECALTQTRCHPCGSAACIGGWFAFWNNGGNTAAFRNFGLHELLGVDRIEERRLCFPDVSVGWDVYRATPQQAARAVRILAETGKCDWKEAQFAEESQ